jgi:hypothetical protein
MPFMMLSYNSLLIGVRALMAGIVYDVIRNDVRGSCLSAYHSFPVGTMMQIILRRQIPIIVSVG